MKVSYKDLIISPKDTRTVAISGCTDRIKPKYFDGDIASLEYPNLNVSIGQIFPVGKRKYKVNSIARRLVGSKIVYELSTGPITKSTLFVFPMLGGDKSLYMYDSLFVNCFISTSKYKNCVSLLYRFSGDTAFLKFESTLSTFDGFIESSDPSPEYVLFTFSVPSKYLKDYTHFVNGKYSKFSSAYKKQILDFHEFNKNGELAQILYKTNERKLRLEEQLGVKLPFTAELYSIIDAEEETFDPDDYI